MSTIPTTGWGYLAPNPNSSSRQLFVKGRNIRARILYGLHLSEEGPRTAEEIAADCDLPVEAVQEAMASCQTALSVGPRTDAADLGDWAGGPVYQPFIPAGQTNYKGVSGANWAWGDPQWHNPGTNGSSDGLTYGDGLFYRGDYLTPKWGRRGGPRRLGPPYGSGNAPGLTVSLKPPEESPGLAERGEG